MRNTNRPLSPHMQVYKPQLTSMLSITHRATGIFLSFGLVVFVSWLALIATHAEKANWLISFFSTWYGQVLLFGWIFCFFYHFSNGIRHLFWDAGKGFDMKTVYTTGYLVLAAAFGLTTITFFITR
ncbi:succinate dehydrogenase, cytochrome b556 subunit [Marinicella sp. W31]|uniref:succinate dehydrogenase, cytochrome b556 subunit n=1 Tax=Marinicella sp. W31 TaxID=3023713 RepID=UPI0037565DAF